MIEKDETVVSVNESKELADILEECYRDTAKFCTVLLSDNFTNAFSDIHKPIFDRLNERKPRKKLAVAGTRGIGKTTTARARAAKAILFAESKFIVYVSKSATHAEMQTENLKKDIMSSRDIRDIFGSVRTKTVHDVEESWSKKTWVASVGDGDNKHFTLVLPRGVGQQVSGLLWKSPSGENIRPDLIICDDMEDPLTIDNELLRAETRDWFFGKLLMCVSRFDPNWEVFYIDTIKHEDCLLQFLIDASDWDHVVAAICDENYKSLAPDFMSDEDIAREVQSHREKGLMDVFAREIMCKPISKEDATFKSDYFKYYGEADKTFVDRLPYIINVVIIDPAKKAKATSAQTGEVVWGIDTETNMLYMRYAEGKRIHPDEQVNDAIDLAARYSARVIGVESTGSGEYVTYPYMNEIIRRGLNMEVIELQARRGQDEFSGKDGGKKMRISSLLHFYRRGLVRHNMVGIGAYETQLLGFPKSKDWDIMDAAGYITEMLDKGGLFFAMTNMKDDSQQSVESEYAEVMSDEYAGVSVNSFYGASP
jgi:uncharacterized protein YuzE